MTRKIGRRKPEVFELRRHEITGMICREDEIGDGVRVYELNSFRHCDPERLRMGLRFRGLIGFGVAREIARIAARES